METAYVNTDKEIWREVPNDAFSPSIHITADGLIGINVGGTVFIKDVRRWHRYADVEMSVCESPIDNQESNKIGSTVIGVDKRWEYGQYLQMLIEVHKAGHDCHTEINEVLAKLREIMFN